MLISFNKNFICHFVLFGIMWFTNTYAQTYWVHQPFTANSAKLQKMVLTEGSCQCADCCDMTYIGAAYIADMERGLTMTPEGELVAMGEFGLHYVDTLTGLTYFFFGIPLQPNWPWTHGCATGDG